MKYFVIIAVCLVAIMAGCTGPEAWSGALDETAPPNPNRAHAQPRQTPQNQEAAPVEQPQDDSAEVQAPAPVPEDPGPQPTRVTATLLGYPSCHVGAVRFYVNRRYRGAFNDEGNVTIDVTPGELTLEVWDSGGHWLKIVNVAEGQSIQVSFSCAEKTTKVQGIERNNDEG